MGAVPRPTGITILAILGFLFGFGLLGIGGLLLAASVAATFLGPIGTILGFLGSALAIVILIIALIQLLLSWGLWSGKNWARIIWLIFLVIYALVALGAVAVGDYVSVIPLIIYALIIYYLTRPGVTAYFKHMPMQPTAPPPPK